MAKRKIKGLPPGAMKNLKNLADMQTKDLKFSIGIGGKEYKLPFDNRKKKGGQRK